MLHRNAGSETGRCTFVFTAYRKHANYIGKKVLSYNPDIKKLFAFYGKNNELKGTEVLYDDNEQTEVEI